jgi:hypothetical protein
VSVEWLLDDEMRQNVHPVMREIWRDRLQVWRNLERDWRATLLVLIRLQGIYGPAIKGTLTKGTVTMVRHPQSGAYVDPDELEPPFDPQAVLRARHQPGRAEADASAVSTARPATGPDRVLAHADPLGAR